MVLLLHLGLGAALLNGLAGAPLREASEALAAFDIPVPSPPPPPPEPPRDRRPAEAHEEGAVDLAARPAAIVQPPPVVPLPLPPALRTADEVAPVSGAEPTAGAGREAGPGQGAGGSGDGSGGGGSGGPGGSLGSEARLLSGALSRGDYRRIRGFGAPRGQAVLALEVGADGRLSGCMPFASSGNIALDAELCRLLERTRWEPARSRNGAPVAVLLRYVATWDRD